MRELLGGMLVKDKEKGAKKTRRAFRWLCGCVLRGEREGRRTGEEASETAVRFQESLSRDGESERASLSQNLLAKKSCVSRSGPASGSLLCSGIGWSTSWETRPRCKCSAGSRGAAAEAAFHMLIKAVHFHGLISAAEGRLEEGLKF